MHKMNNFLKFLLSLIATSGFLLSCGIKELEKPQNENKIINIPIPNETALCITAVEYPKDYNWQNDDKYGTVKCSIMVESEGRILARIPVGHEYEISSDPDMHRFIANALYTDYSSDTHTIIKRNGEELFRYEGQEMIINMAVFEDEVHTLGKNRKAQGFTYRINGKVLIESNGVVFPYITKDGNALTFCYTRINDEGETEYYCYNKGQHHKFFPANGVIGIYDAVYHNGKVNYLGAYYGGYALLIANELKKEILSIQSSGKFNDARIISIRDNNLYFGTSWYIPYMRKNIISIYENKKILRSWILDDRISKASIDKDNTSLDENSFYGILPKSMIVFHRGEEYQLPKEYRIISNPPIFLHENTLYAGLSSKENKYPILWTKDGTREIKINGFISSISIIEKDYNVEKDYNESSQDTVLE